MPNWNRDTDPERCKKISQETGRVSREIYAQKRDYKNVMEDPRPLPRIPISEVRAWLNR